MKKQFDEVFNKVDYIYLPTSPASAFEFGVNAFDPIKEYLYDVFTIPYLTMISSYQYNLKLLSLPSIFNYCHFFIFK
jgi:hypothetical protein